MTLTPQQQAIWDALTAAPEGRTTFDLISSLHIIDIGARVSEINKRLWRDHLTTRIACEDAGESRWGGRYNRYRIDWNNLELYKINATSQEATT